MAHLQFTPALKRFFPSLTEKKLSGTTVSEVLLKLETAHPGIRDFLVDEQGALRQHINIFVDGRLIEDRKTLSDAVTENGEVLIFQALSGG